MPRPALFLILACAGGCLGAGCGGGDDDDGSAGTDADTDADADADSDADSDADTDADLTDWTPDPPWYQCPTVDVPEDAIEVVAFDRVDQYFGDEDRRTVETDITFPEETHGHRVGLVLELECPESGLCDHWDRAGSLHLVENPGTEDEERVEIVRFVTPYRVGMCQFVDVTPLASRLVGQKRLTSFIDTWVGPGHDQGEGWRTSARFVFFADYITSYESIGLVTNVWGMRSITVGQTGEGEDVGSQTEPVTFLVPQNAGWVEARLIATGHSFGNTYNCAEFCQMRQDIYVNGELFSVNPWRPDCADNPVSPQYGTWEYPRNGWCPGSIVVGHTIDISQPAVFGSADNELDFDIRMADGEEYINLSPVDLLPYELFSLQVHQNLVFE